MKKLFNWLLIVAGVMVAITFIVRLLNPEFAAEMDRRADSTRAADSVKNAMQAQLRAEQAAENERRAKLLNVSAEKALERISEIQGVQITESQLKDGTPRTMAQYSSFIVECIGDKSNLSRVTLLMLNDGNKQSATLNAVAAQRILKNVLNSDDMSSMSDAIRNNKPEFVVSGRSVKISTTDMGSNVKGTQIIIE